MERVVVALGGNALLRRGQDDTFELSMLPHDEPDGRPEYSDGTGDVAQNRLARQPDWPGDQEPADHRQRCGDSDPEPVQPRHRALVSHNSSSRYATSALGLR